MSQSRISPEGFASEADDDAIQYRPVNLLAVLSLVLGIASALALAGPVLLFIPGAALLVSLLAWRSIARSEGGMAGRNAILWGLAFAAFFTAMSVGRIVTQRVLVVRDARQISETFIALLLANHPQKAHQLQFLEHLRQPTGTDLWLHYQTTPNDYDALRRFVDAPLVHALLSLGKKAEVRYYATEDITESSGRTYVVLLYTVTFENQGKPQTFFARITSRRDIDLESGILSWSIDNYESGVRPFVSSK
jgi:hypothetical protein